MPSLPGAQTLVQGGNPLMNQHEDRNDVLSGDGVWDGHITTRDDDVDLSNAFWGATRAWSDTGDVPSVRRGRAVTDSVPRVRRRSSDRTGPVQRTRTHRVIDHGVIDRVDVADDDGGVDVPLADTSRDDLAPSGVMHRLGLGRVDPLVVRIGVIVVIAVLLVPIALALRATAPEPSVTTDDVPAAGAAVSPSGVAEMPTPQGAGLSAPVVPGVAPAEAPATVIDPSTLSPAPVINPEFGSATAPVSAGTSGTAAGATDAEALTESAPSTGAVSQSADVDEPAARVARSCAQRYTIVFGDSWFGLADRTAVALDELLRLNGATVETPLYPGTDVCLPARASVPPASATASPEPAATATTAPATPSTLAPQPAYVRVDEQTAQAIIREVWPDDLEERALTVAFRESRYDVTARNYCCYGLFQIYWSVHRDWLDDLGITSPEHLFDARLNATAALELYTRSGGWGPWT